MKKFFGIALASIIMMGFVTPVFAVEGAGTSSTDVEYVVEESFTWSVPAKITVKEAGDTTYLGDQLGITSNDLGNNKKIIISLVGSTNYSNGYLNLKKSNDNTLYPYVLTHVVSELAGSGILVESEPTTSNPITILDSSYGLSMNIRAEFASHNTTPTNAGTYTDTLTFRADVVDTN